MNHLLIIFLTIVITIICILIHGYESNLIDKKYYEFFTIESIYKMPSHIPKKYRDIADKLINLGKQIDEDSKLDCDTTEYLHNMELTMK